MSSIELKFNSFELDSEVGRLVSPELELLFIIERDNSQRSHSQQGRDVSIVLLTHRATGRAPLLSLTRLHEARRSCLTLADGILCQRLQ